MVLVGVAVGVDVGHVVDDLDLVACAQSTSESQRRDNLIYALFVARVEVQHRVEGHTGRMVGIAVRV